VRACTQVLGVPGLGATLAREHAGTTTTGPPAASFRLRRGRATAMVRHPPLIAQEATSADTAANP
jgi:hypothetical protein